MNSPVELISRTRRHLVRINALRGILNLGLPLLVTLALLATFNYLRGFAWDRWGYSLSVGHAAVLKKILCAAALAELIAMAILAVRAYFKMNDYVATAARIDDRIGAHQEILTLATMTDPARPEMRDRRSPLFPMLWRRTIAYFDLFEPRREFPLEPLAPLGRSLIVLAAGLVALTVGLAAMLKPPTAMDKIARDLRNLAGTLSAPDASPASHDLAAAVRGVSADLENPKLPPEQKMQELAALKREVEKLQQQNQKDRGSQASRLASASGGSGNGSGNSSGTGNGSGQGKGAGAGSGQGQGPGQASGSGPSQGDGSGGKDSKSGQQMVKLSNDIDKAQTQVAQDSGPRDKTQGSQQLADNGSGVAPKAGNNPNASGPLNDPNRAGTAQMPKPGGKNGDSASRSAVPGPQANGSSGRKDDTGSAGDTHLGEIPKSETFARFYAAGEGPPIQIHDARYATFRIPPAVESKGAGGSLVADNGEPKAAAPYSNLPLKQDRITDTPDEQQLVPPRYRDLIH
ncbi:MAG TPA: hypothetical protein VHY56_11195 [Candidatus Binataceae bacterium]|nr:hypothetical protein [Candidatus Binataceae bacterium]